MGSKPSRRQTTDVTQLDRFKKKARELGADESDDALDRSLDRLNLKPVKKAVKKLGVTGTRPPSDEQ